MLRTRQFALGGLGTALSFRTAAKLNSRSLDHKAQSLRVQFPYPKPSSLELGRKAGPAGPLLWKGPVCLHMSNTRSGFGGQASSAAQLHAKECKRDPELSGIPQSQSQSLLLPFESVQSFLQLRISQGEPLRAHREQRQRAQGLLWASAAPCVEGAGRGSGSGAAVELVLQST